MQDLSKPLPCPIDSPMRCTLIQPVFLISVNGIFIYIGSFYLLQLSWDTFEFGSRLVGVLLPYLVVYEQPVQEIIHRIDDWEATCSWCGMVGTYKDRNLVSQKEKLL